MKISNTAYGTLRVTYHSSGSMDGARPRYYYLDGLEMDNGQHLVNGDLGTANQLYRDVYRSRAELAEVIKHTLRKGR